MPSAIRVFYTIRHRIKEYPRSLPFSATLDERDKVTGLNANNRKKIHCNSGYCSTRRNNGVIRGRWGRNCRNKGTIISWVAVKIRIASDKPTASTTTSATWSSPTRSTSSKMVAGNSTRRIGVVVMIAVVKEVVIGTASG